MTISNFGDDSYQHIIFINSNIHYQSRSSSRIQPVEVSSRFEHGDTESSENSEEDDDDDDGGDPHEVIIEG